MKYCSLQHQSVLPSPVVAVLLWLRLFILELFLHQSLVAYWAPTDLGSLSLVSYLFAFSHSSWDSQGKNTEVVCHSLLLPAAKSLQSCPTLCDPTDCSLPGFSVHGILQARTLEWVAISFSNAWKWKVKVKSLSHVWLLATPWTTAHQAPPSMGFSGQQYWSGVPLPSPLILLVVKKSIRKSWQDQENK